MAVEDRSAPTPRKFSSKMSEIEAQKCDVKRYPKGIDGEYFFMKRAPSRDPVRFPFARLNMVRQPLLADKGRVDLQRAL